MHMADALLAPTVAATMYAASTAVAGVSIHKVKNDEAMEKLPVMGVMSAFVFAGQMINYTIPGTGASGHLCGAMMLTALLGPYAGFLSMIVILAIQCLFFADGGLMALGANVWNMAFYGCFVGYFLIYRPIMRSRKLKMQTKIVLASILGCVICLELGAFSVCVETTASGITKLPFAAFTGLMLPIHLAIGLVEGVITSAVLLFVYQARPSLLECVDEAGTVEYGCNGSVAGAGLAQTGAYADGTGMEGTASDGAGRSGAGRSSSKLSTKGVVVILAAMALVIGGVGSQFASSNPDGLEWSVGGLGADDEEEAQGIAAAASEIQEKTAFMPGYAFSSNPDSAAGTSAAGLMGACIVALAAAGICAAGGFFRKKNKMA